MISRRAFIGSVAALVAPLATDAQPARRTPARRGFIGNAGPATTAPSIEALRQGLRDRGWIENQTLTIEYRWAEGKIDRFPALADELIQ